MATAVVERVVVNDRDKYEVLHEYEELPHTPGPTLPPPRAG